MSHTSTHEHSFASRPAPARAGSADFVSGRTRLYAILGHPIEQARSPETVTYELRRRGQDALLVPMDIAPGDFDSLFPQLLKLGNLDGLVVTVPHKTRIPPHVKHLGPMAKICGSVSVLARCRDGEWVGEMFDGVGCVMAIERRGLPVAGKRVQLLGAGGAGAAIAAELARKGVAALRIVEPDRQRGEQVVRALGAAQPSLAVTHGPSQLDDIDLLINATAVGMLDENAAPVDLESLPSSVVVMDAIMDPEHTRLLRTAQARGCVCVYGREMLDSQIARVCDFLLRARQHGLRDFVLHPEQ
jgi:shikimate dehydrogenase